MKSDKRLKLNKGNKVQGFTLSEVLITLGVIAVVAVLTIPTLIANSQKQEAFSKLQKAISVISSAATQIRDENGGDMTGVATNTLELANAFNPYLKLIKFCKNAADSENCYISNSANVYSLDGEFIGGISPYEFYSYSKIVTADGFMYWFGFASSDCSGSQYIRNGVNENCGNATVDINGAKLPNTFGKDIFVITINKYNVTPRVSSGQCDLALPSTWNGVGCAGRAIQEGGIKYY